MAIVRAWRSMQYGFTKLAIAGHVLLQVVLFGSLSRKTMSFKGTKQRVILQYWNHLYLLVSQYSNIFVMPQVKFVQNRTVFLPVWLACSSFWDFQLEQCSSCNPDQTWYPVQPPCPDQQRVHLFHCKSVKYIRSHHHHSSLNPTPCPSQHLVLIPPLEHKEDKHVV